MLRISSLSEVKFRSGCLAGGKHTQPQRKTAKRRTDFFRIDSASYQSEQKEEESFFFLHKKEKNEYFLEERSTSTFFCGETGEEIGPQGKRAPQGLLKRDTHFPQKFSEKPFPHTTYSSSTMSVENVYYRLALILVLISLTVSANAGSFFISFSTLSME